MNNTMDNQQEARGRRSKRWKRRESDGAAWASTLNLGELSTTVEQQQQQSIVHRWCTEKGEEC